MSFLKFIETGENRQHKLLMVMNTRNIHLGWISWYPRWKKYVFSTCNRDVVLDSVCLKEVIDELEKLK